MVFDEPAGGGNGDERAAEHFKCFHMSNKYLSSMCVTKRMGVIITLV